VPHERLAEAGVWIARLHGDARGRATENGFRRWLQAEPDNARAFELATEVWEDAEKLRRFVPLRPAVPDSRPRWRGVVAAAALATVLLVVGVVWFQQAGVIATAVGEQRQLVLEDGTRIFLNTDTRLAVKYDQGARRVELRSGEALFNVARRSDWPFIVVAGDRQVEALGTSFVVRKEGQRLAVTLVEGKVSVSSRLAPASDDSAVSSQQAEPGSGPEAQTQPGANSVQPRNDVFTLTPGQRLTFASGSATKLDTPSVEKAIAWRRGQVILDDTPLEVAADEMNRYNSTKLVVAHPDAAALLINGLFQAGDSTHFAKAVAQAYGLEVVERGDEIILSGRPND
jgi:transmembrane sensor